MELNKIKTYVNFAKKSNNILYGLDDIIKSKNVNLIFVSEELSSSSQKKLQTFAENNKYLCYFLTNSQLFEICEKESVKVMAITDKNLANAIKLNLTNKS